MPGLKQHLKRVEAKQREIQQLRDAKRQFLFVTFLPFDSVLEDAFQPPQPGEHTVEDLYIDRDIEWRPNYVMLNGTAVHRNTGDPGDHGVVYDERGVQHDWSEGPPQGLPILSALREGGKIDPIEVKHWPGVKVLRRRVALGSNEPKKTRAGSR